MPTNWFEHWHGRKISTAECDFNPGSGSTAMSTAVTNALSTKASLGHSHAQTDVTGLVTDLAAKELAANKGVANGYAGLDASTKVTWALFPTSATSTGLCVGNDSRLSDARTPLSHSHAAADIASGTIATARLGSGTADATTFLRGDQAWATAGSVNIKQTEVDFGATPVADAEFTITDADVSATSQLLAQVAYEAPTGKDLDELEMDALDLRCQPASGQFVLRAIGRDGYVHDKFKVNYLIG